LSVPCILPNSTHAIQGVPPCQTSHIEVGSDVADLRLCRSVGAALHRARSEAQGSSAKEVNAEQSGGHAGAKIAEARSITRRTHTFALAAIALWPLCVVLGRWQPRSDRLWSEERLEKKIGPGLSPQGEKKRPIST
jgi:hypothetical protein